MKKKRERQFYVSYELRSKRIFCGKSACFYELSFERACIGVMADFLCTVEAEAANKAVFSFLSREDTNLRQNF